MDKSAKTLWNIREDFWNIMEQLSDPELDLEAMNEQLVIQSGELKEKAPDYAAVIAEKLNRAKYLKERAKAFTAAASRETKLADKLKHNLDCALKEAGLNEFESRDFRFSYRASKSVVLLAPVDDIPDEYVNIKRTENKTAIANAIDAGEDIPWAEIKQKQNLQIK